MFVDAVEKNNSKHNFELGIHLGHQVYYLDFTEGSFIILLVGVPYNERNWATWKGGGGAILEKLRGWQIFHSAPRGEFFLDFVNYFFSNVPE